MSENFDPETGEVLPSTDTAARETRPVPTAGSLVGLDPGTVDKLLATVTSRQYIKRLEKAVDARLDELDWDALTESVNAQVETHVAAVTAADGAQEWEDSDDVAAGASADPNGREDDGENTAAEAQHSNVYDFFERVYSPYYELHDDNKSAINRERPVLVWCPRWWLHRSVVGRIVAAWYAWEDAYTAGGGAMSSWILEHADRHFDRIMAEDGPFRKCKNGHADDVGEYPTEACPEALRMEDTEKESE